MGLLECFEEAGVKQNQRQEETFLEMHSWSKEKGKNGIMKQGWDDREGEIGKLKDIKDNTTGVT